MKESADFFGFGASSLAGASGSSPWSGGVHDGNSDAAWKSGYANPMTPLPPPVRKRWMFCSMESAVAVSETTVLTLVRTP